MTAARAQRLPITVRGGGHSMARLSVASEGMLIDLRLLDEVTVAPDAATVHIGGGATWGRLAAALRPHGLALTAGDTAGVGVGGLTVGGGIGWMVRRFGLAIDSLVGAQLVTAAGEVREISGLAHPELFWAVRGGGGNFGIVTRFDFRPHAVSEVVFGTMGFAVSGAGRARELVRAWWEVQSGADERLTSVLSLLPAMPSAPAQGLLQVCFAGDHALDPRPGRSRREGAGVGDGLRAPHRGSDGGRHPDDRRRAGRR